MADTVQSSTPSGLEIAQCRLQSQFVVENCRARTECRIDVSTCIRAILGPYTGRFFQEKPLFQEKTTSKSFITRGRCKLHSPAETKPLNPHRSKVGNPSFATCFSDPRKFSALPGAVFNKHCREFTIKKDNYGRCGTKLFGS